ncbi:MAG: GMC family oxidoreductase [Nitrospira sp.]
MHIDFNLSVNGLPKIADFCVVGSGPAGMTVALELGDYGRSVILLEGGGLNRSAESQEIYKGDVIGDPYFELDSARLRYLGGTSGHWGGHCLPLAEIDFQKKEGFEDAYWPIEKNALDPFLGKALSILEIPEPPHDVVVDREFGIRQIGASHSLVRFGEKYRERLNSSTNVIYVTNANLTGLQTDGQRVVSVTATNYSGQSTDVKAKHFILAMGGIENSRMLLWCNHQTKGKIVDPRAPLGRYWMEHPAFTVGEALVDLKLTPLYQGKSLVGLTDAVKGKLSTLNCTISVRGMSTEGTRALLRDLLCVAPKAGAWAASLVGENLVCGKILRAQWEQEPIWNNHVKLSETKRDRFGIPMTELHWKKTGRDLATLRKSLSQFNDYVMARNFGRIKFANWVFGNDGFPDYRETDDEGAGWHHMGGTRMADTVKNGVVDTNCRVFGQNNLYVAGSSVFPSGGAANPTLTIVQLALRLAKHLRNV